MILFIFLGILLGSLAIGVPIAFTLFLSGIRLMWHMDLFDAQLIAQNAVDGTNNFVLLAARYSVPPFLAAYHSSRRKAP